MVISCANMVYSRNVLFLRPCVSKMIAVVCVIRGNAAGNTAGAGIKLATIPRDGNLIAENPAVAVGRIASRPREIYTYCHVTLRPITFQLSADSVDSCYFFTVHSMTSYRLGLGVLNI